MVKEAVAGVSLQRRTEHTVRRMTKSKRKKIKRIMPAKKQLFLNYKGGTGKTSISAAYGCYLARRGKKVLMVDLDAQAHLTTCLNHEGVLHNKSLYSVLVNKERLSNLIVPTDLPTLQLVPSSISLSSTELSLFRMPSREYKLRRALQTVSKDYDYIIIDSAPSIGLLSLNAILSADEIIIPVLADFLSFHGLKILMETLASIEKDFSFYLQHIYIFLNRFNSAYSICKEAREAVHKFYPEYALETVINESHDIIEASSLGKSIFELNPGAKAARDIKDLVEEINGL